MELHRSLSSEMVDSDDNPERELEAELQDQYEQYDQLGRTPPRSRTRARRSSRSSLTRLSRNAISSGKLWPVSTCRMGKGKGEPDFWVAVVRPGQVLFEVGGVPEDVARTALNRVAHKLPARCRLATRLVEV